MKRRRSVRTNVGVAMKRAHISLKTKLASALLALGHVPYEQAKLMTAHQVISLYQFDHNALHALGGPDTFWNLTPMLRAPHREKSRRDTAIVAKVRRLSADQEDFRRRMLKPDKKPVTRNGRWPRGRKLRSRNNFEGRQPSWK